MKRPGRGITVAVLDSGVAAVRQLGSFRSVDHRGNDVEPGDVSRQSHGTKCAYLIRGLYRRMPGVAPYADLLSVRVTTADGLPHPKYVASAFLTLARLRVPIASCSFSMGSYGGELTAAINEYLRTDGIIVAAAGLRGHDNEFPKLCRGAVIVGGVNERNQPLRSNNSGPYIDVSAPAKQLSAVNKVGRTVQFGGTSGATALVAGVCALALAEARNTDRLATVAPALPRLLQKTADDVGARGRDALTGFGVVNARKLLSRIRQLP
ncbi:MAG: S8/S53 family peptidase [Proteobacteria bacterium]|nr:S8/S53 family peptidase [Pseudomonadota bacterium]